MNEQARLLGLGSGGFDVLYANLTRGLGLAAEEGAHVMALPYTPVQVAVAAREEDGELPTGSRAAGRLLHAPQPAGAGVRRGSAGARVAYVQVPAGRCRSRSPTPCGASGARPARDRGRRRGVPRRRRRNASPRARRSPGRGRGRRCGRLRRRAGDRRNRLAARPRRRSRGRGRQRRRRARRPSDPRGARVRGDPRERHRGVSHHARDRARACDVAADRGRAGRPRTTSRAGRRPAPGCRSRTWVAAPRRIRGSSRPPSPRASRTRLLA